VPFLTYQELRRQEPSPLVLEGMRIKDLDDLSILLQLDGDQPKSLTEILRQADQEYLRVEKRHLSRSLEKGHAIVTINPFPDDLRRLENRVRAKLDKILTNPNQKEEAEKLLPQGDRLFAFGREQVCIDSWVQDGWYRWKITRPREGRQAELISEGGGPDMPPELKRFR
jgi:hypothetical protein